jgi:hypothetical protein
LNDLIIASHELPEGPRADSVAKSGRRRATTETLKYSLEVRRLSPSERAETLPYARGVTDSADGALRARATTLKLTER